MKTYHFDFFGRENGAIGITSHYTKDVQAENYDQALLKLYDTHEHISVRSWTEWTNGELTNSSSKS